MLGCYNLKKQIANLVKTGDAKLMGLTSHTCDHDRQAATTTVVYKFLIFAGLETSGP